MGFLTGETHLVNWSCQAIVPSLAGSAKSMKEQGADFCFRLFKR